MMKTFDFTKARSGLAEIEKRAAERAAATDMNYGIPVAGRVVSGEETPDTREETPERPSAKEENKSKAGRAKKKA